MIQRTLISILFFLLVVCSVQAQGWQRTYPNSNCPENECNNEVAAITSTSDGGYVAIENIIFTNPATPWFNDTIISVLKVDAQGYTVWRQPVLPSNNLHQEGISIHETPDSHYLVTFLEGINNQPNPLFTVFGLKLNYLGSEVWRKGFGTNGSAPTNTANTIITTDGNYVFTSSLGYWSTHNTQIDKVDAQGNTIWTKTHANVGARSVDALPNNQFAIGGVDNQSNSLFNIYDSNGNLVTTKGGSNAFGLKTIKYTSDDEFITIGIQNPSSWPLYYAPQNMTKLDATGNESWVKTIPPNDILLTGLDAAKDGYVVIQFDTSSLENHFLHKVDTAGNVLWSKSLIDPNISSWIGHTLNSIHIDKQQNIIVGGSINGRSTIWKLMFDGTLTLNKINGNVYFDSNNNCTKDGSEIGLSTFVVEVIQNGVSNFTMTDSLGNYVVLADTGLATITAFPPANNTYWQTCTNYTATLTTFPDSATIDIGMESIVPCPNTIVEIATPSLRQCCTNTYTVNYCNFGTQDANNTYIEVDIDDDLIVTGSSIPWMSQTGNIYTFSVGNLAISQCGQFTIDVVISTTTNVTLGQVHCTEAHIFPDTLCAMPANWSGAEIDVLGTCLADSIEFIVKNIGSANMVQQRNYFVIEDNLIMLANPFQLNQGDSLRIAIPANGSTYRLIAEQEVNHPTSQYPTAAIEGCTNTGTFSIGFYNIFGDDDDNIPYLSIDCTENIGSYDPNDKQASPIGHGNTHDIFQNAPIDYMIRFQNTGTDTAFTVVIRDTIDTDFLNVSSIQYGASSHTYQASIENSNVLVFTFNNIMLPASNVNEPASNGFVKFKIQQNIDNPLGSVIENSAAIYFDFNAPIITNTAFHTVAPFPLTVHTNTLWTPETINVTAFPNPLLEKAIFRFDDGMRRDIQFTVFDATGRKVHEQLHPDSFQFDFYRNQLSSGLYFYTIQENGKMISQGKIIIQ